jgi:hypothetical protein
MVGEADVSQLSVLGFIFPLLSIAAALPFVCFLNDVTGDTLNGVPL